MGPTSSWKGRAKEGIAKYLDIEYDYNSKESQEDTTRGTMNYEVLKNKNCLTRSILRLSILQCFWFVKCRVALNLNIKTWTQPTRNFETQDQKAEKHFLVFENGSVVILFQALALKY